MTMRLTPSMTPDTKFFWDGLRQNQLLIQRCTSCGTLRHPPRPMCPACHALGWDTTASSGRGTLLSFVMPQHPQYPWFDYPYIVALVELDEGTRLVSNLIDITPDEASIGMAVEVVYVTFDDDVVLHQFRAVAP
jgi:uncharacterized OB-fold protein